MCNIAGYTGNKQAAPILLEMIRRQQPYDGDMSTGIVTIHEGKLHCRKVFGDVDTLIRETDALDLPGTVGIAHTRPGFSKDFPPMHPFLSMDGGTALAQNGTGYEKYRYLRREAYEMLKQNGYVFQYQNSDPSKMPHGGEIGCYLTDYYMKQGKSPAEAMKLTFSTTFTDLAGVVVTQNEPDRVFAVRLTRPLEVVIEKGETYLATTRFAFSKELKNAPMMLPTLNICAISAKGLEIFDEKVENEIIEEMSPYVYAEGYKRMEALLKSDRAPMYFDELEFAVDKEMRDLWPNDRTFVQHARLVYDLLWQFDQEGRLKREMRIQENKNGPRHRWYFSL